MSKSSGSKRCVKEHSLKGLKRMPPGNAGGENKHTWNLRNGPDWKTILLYKPSCFPGTVRKETRGFCRCQNVGSTTDPYPNTPWECHRCRSGQGWFQGGQCRHLWHKWHTWSVWAIVHESSHQSSSSPYTSSSNFVSFRWDWGAQVPGGSKYRT